MSRPAAQDQVSSIELDLFRKLDNFLSSVTEINSQGSVFSRVNHQLQSGSISSGNFKKSINIQAKFKHESGAYLPELIQNYEELSDEDPKKQFHQAFCDYLVHKGKDVSDNNRPLLEGAVIEVSKLLVENCQRIVDFSELQQGILKGLLVSVLGKKPKIEEVGFDRSIYLALKQNPYNIFLPRYITNPELLNDILDSNKEIADDCFKVSNRTYSQRVLDSHGNDRTKIMLPQGETLFTYYIKYSNSQAAQTLLPVLLSNLKDVSLLVDQKVGNRPLIEYVFDLEKGKDGVGNLYKELLDILCFKHYGTLKESDKVSEEMLEKINSRLQAPSSVISSFEALSFSDEKSQSQARSQ